MLTLSATREELEPRFNKALREYRKKINMPGFRPGQMPVSIIKKRFGKEIESEEINNYVQEVFREEVVPKYNPVGEPHFEDLTWENDKLEVRISIGVKPEFELRDIGTFTLDKMVHDVTDEEVEEEVQRSLERGSNMKESENPATEKCRITVDADPLDEKGEVISSERDENKEIDLSSEENKIFLDALKGKKKGDTVEIELGEEDEKETYRLTVKKVMELEAPEMDEDFVREATRGEVASVDEYRSRIRNQIQNYYDQASVDMLRQDIMEQLIEAHTEMDVPEVVLKSFQSAWLQRFRQQQEQPLPDDFNEEEYKESIRTDALREARWAFILEELEKRYDDLEITSEDVDSRLDSEAARYGLPVEMVKNFYAQSAEQLEKLRQNIRTDKLFDRILEQVEIRELTKEAYQEKKEKERKTTSEK